MKYSVIATESKYYFGHAILMNQGFYVINVR